MGWVVADGHVECHEVLSEKGVDVRHVIFNDEMVDALLRPLSFVEASKDIKPNQNPNQAGRDVLQK